MIVLIKCDAVETDKLCGIVADWRHCSSQQGMLAIGVPQGIMIQIDSRQHFLAFAFAFYPEVATTDAIGGSKPLPPSLTTTVEFKVSVSLQVSWLLFSTTMVSSEVVSTVFMSDRNDKAIPKDHSTSLPSTKNVKVMSLDSG
jgi:hypothetical protein